ncbi:hypothetical protein [Natrinema sp. 1APR25-10V2]|uniref:hypothetical protein n=1 Tax=Natrinema sp. 1APR25-10V2 TaxID=2951081 RepID=UPI0028747476|nr:hypothetical protein [Natrinema sp. 1APR25-10V2]MDS0477984.1 hypothetical protein [Natrinema sp. 1APR25-10V2]
MKRRTLLTVLSMGTVTTAGCITGLNRGTSTNNGGADQREYERCGKYIIDVNSLPDTAKDEARTAIEDDHYETAGELLLPEVVDINGSYISRRKDGERVYYELSVEPGGEVTRLRAEEMLPKTSAVQVENATERNLTANVRIEHEGDLLVEKTVDIGVGGDVDLDEEAEYKYGSYRAEVNVPNEKKLKATELTWGVNSWSFQADIVITSDRIRLRQAVAESESCKWNRDGELVSGLKDT